MASNESYYEVTTLKKLLEFVNSIATEREASPELANIRAMSPDARNIIEPESIYSGCTEQLPFNSSYLTTPKQPACSNTSSNPYLVSKTNYRDIRRLEHRVHPNEG